MKHRVSICIIEGRIIVVYHFSTHSPSYAVIGVGISMGGRVGCTVVVS